MLTKLAEFPSQNFLVKNRFSNISPTSDFKISNVTTQLGSED